MVFRDFNGVEKSFFTYNNVWSGPMRLVHWQEETIHKCQFPFDNPPSNCLTRYYTEENSYKGTMLDEFARPAIPWPWGTYSDTLNSDYVLRDAITGIYDCGKGYAYDIGLQTDLSVDVSKNTVYMWNSIINNNGFRAFNIALSGYNLYENVSWVVSLSMEKSTVGTFRPFDITVTFYYPSMYYDVSNYVFDVFLLLVNVLLIYIVICDLS